MRQNQAQSEQKRARSPTLIESLMNSFVQPDSAQSDFKRSMTQKLDSSNHSHSSSMAVIGGNTQSQMIFAADCVYEDIVPNIFSDRQPCLDSQRAESIEYANGGRFITTTHSDGTVNFWSAKDFSMSDSLMTYNPITLIKAAPNRNLVALCNPNSQISLYDLKTMRRTGH